mgnify:CR=1 FL=1
MIRRMLQNMSTLASRVKEAIDDAELNGIKIKDIAKACGVTIQSVYQWMQEGERTEIDGSNIAELAHITGFEVRWIMNNKGAKKRIFPQVDEITLQGTQALLKLPPGLRAEQVRGLYSIVEHLTHSGTQEDAEAQ